MNPSLQWFGWGHFLVALAEVDEEFEQRRINNLFMVVGIKHGSSPHDHYVSTIVPTMAWGGASHCRKSAEGTFSCQLGIGATRG
jgi:hypothetical protein